MGAYPAPHAVISRRGCAAPGGTTLLAPLPTSTGERLGAGESNSALLAGGPAASRVANRREPGRGLAEASSRTTWGIVLFRGLELAC